MKYVRKISTKPYKKRMYKKRRTFTKKVHGTKTFVAEFLLQDVIQDRYGANVDGYNRNALSVTLAQHPLYDNLKYIYRQMAITSVDFQYRPIFNVSTDAVVASQIHVAEDKDHEIAIIAKNVRSQDNVRNYTSTRKWHLFVKKPRPALYQQDSAGNRIKVINAAKNVQWLSVDTTADPTLKHLCGQMVVQDSTDVANTVSTRVGELWCKMYITCKEQSLGTAA